MSSYLFLIITKAKCGDNHGGADCWYHPGEIGRKKMMSLFRTTEEFKIRCIELTNNEGETHHKILLIQAMIKKMT
jgi:hypothetical protein